MPEVTHAGFNHIGLATNDIKSTIAFYTEVLGFDVVRHDRFTLVEGGAMEHVFMDCGNGELISFIAPEAEATRMFTDAYDPGINKGLGVPSGFYHFAFNADSEEQLVARQRDLLGKGVNVSEIADHDWCKSIYFFDPVNQLSLEFCTQVRAFNEDDRTLSTRFEAPMKLLDYDQDAFIETEGSRFEVIGNR